MDGTAEAQSDYIPLKETVVFEEGETSKTIEIKIVNDNEWEPDEVFFVRLSVKDTEQDCVVGKRAITQVTILDDDSEFPAFSICPCLCVCMSVCVSVSGPPRWPCGSGVRLESRKSRVRIPLAPGFFGVESHQ